MKRMFMAGIITLLFLAACQNQSDITAQAVAERPITMGVNFPMTGGLSVYGEPLLEGFSLGVDEVNKAGGVNGRPIKIVLEDNGGDPKRAVNAAQKLIETDGVDIQLTTLVGPTGAIAPIAESQKKVLLYAAAVDTFAEQNTWVFKDSVDAGYDCEVLIKEALKQGMARVAIFGALAEFTLECRESIDQGLAGNGTLVAYETYNQGDTDFRAQLTKIKAKAPDVVFLPAYSNDCIQIWKQIKELKLDTPFMLPFTQSGCGDAKAMDELQGTPLQIIGLDFVVDMQSKEYEDFIAGFRAKYGKEPSLPFFTMLAYDWAHYLAKAFEKCPDASDSECVRTALEQAKHTGALGYIEYTPKHTTFRPRALIEWKDGVWAASS